MDKELKKAKSSSECDSIYTFTDGCEICLSNERFVCPELLFNPQLNGFNIDGIDKVVFDSIMKCNNEEHKDLFLNIVLSGGCTLFKGFQERIEKEISHRAPQSTEIKIIAPSERKYAAWIGGSIFASLPTFQNKVIKHDEYNDSGSSIIHQKCI